MKKYIPYIIILLLITITLLNFNIITKSINDSFNMCIKNLLPSIIPFLLISNILTKCNLLSDTRYLFLLCIISGSPSSSKYIKDYLDNKRISLHDASILLSYLQYYNPIYILNVIGIITLNDKKLGLIILVSNIISSLFLIKKVNINNIDNYNKIDFFNVISTSIKELINILLYIMGIITLFFIITSYISIIFHISIKYRFLYGFIEITQGINYLKYSSLNTYMKTIISSIFISFGGFSMHAHIFGILDNKKIRYKPYIVSRIKHSILSSVIATILFYILH